MFNFSHTRLDENAPLHPKRQDSLEPPVNTTVEDDDRESLEDDDEGAFGENGAFIEEYGDKRRSDVFA